MPFRQMSVGDGSRQEYGPDSFGYLFAATIGREARREYFFSGLRYILNTADENDFRPGDIFRYDLAAGMRPYHEAAPEQKE